MKAIKYTIEALGTTLSIISLAFSSFMQTWLTIVIVIFGLSCFFFLIYENITSNAYNERVCRNSKAIEEAMNEIINSHGNICIMSRDLSWITPQISATLESKKTMF